ncbi:MAG: TetR/AcrR family transcriptional regulator [Faecousia sp.]
MIFNIHLLKYFLICSIIAGKGRNNQQCLSACQLIDKYFKSVEERYKRMKTDLRVRYTQKVIQEAFWKLLKEKPLAKITVKEVCDLAEINRGTFYKHYMDCYDLMDKLQEEAIRQMEQRLASIESTGIRSVLIALLQMLQNDAGLSRIFHTRGQSGDFTRRIVGCCYRYMETHIEQIPGMSQNDRFKTMNYSFLVGGCTSAIECWIHTGMTESPEAVAEQILQLSKAFLTGLFETGPVK